jgi:hypothetical protein
MTIHPITDAGRQAPTGDYAERARAVRAEYEQAIESVRRDAGIAHPVATRINAAAAFSRASHAMRQLEAGEDRRRLFAEAGADSSIWRGDDHLAYRGAREAAERITSAEDAARAINSASQVGDATAVLATAHEVIRRAEADPDGEYGEVASDYLRQAGHEPMLRDRLSHHGAEQIVWRAAYHVSQPDELHGLHPEQIDLLATRDPAEAIARATAPQQSAWSRVGGVAGVGYAAG